MTQAEKNIKRLFDLVFSSIGLILLGWFILLLAIISKAVKSRSGFFMQKRVGQNGKLFTIYKIETIFAGETKKNKSQTAFFFKTIRKFKIDELPQLWNVFEGTMSFVGPRPDVLGFADLLTGEDKLILTVKPGITGPATLLFRDEERFLEKQANPEKYNKEIIWPQKVNINVKYVKEYNFRKDLYYIFKTLLP